MAGFGFILGGMAKGYGDSKLEQAKAKREAALEDLKWQRQMQMRGDDRAFTAGESEKSRSFTESQNELTRAQQDKRDTRDDEARADAAALKRRDDLAKDFQLNEGLSYEDAMKRANETVAQDRSRSRLPSFSDPSEVDAALQSGKIKDGDKFVMPDGSIGTARLPDAVKTTQAPTAAAPAETAPTTTPKASSQPAPSPDNNTAPDTFADGFRKGLGMDPKEKRPKAKGNAGAGW